MSPAPTAAPSASTVLADPQFHGLPPDEQVKALSKIDSNFAGLPPEEQQKVLVTSRPQATGSLPEPPASSALPGPVRESILGAAGGFGIPETMNPVSDLASGVASLGAPLQTTGEKVALGLGVPPPLYRMARGLGQGVVQAGTDIGTGLAKMSLGEEGGGEQAAHGGGQAVGILASLRAGREAPEALDATEQAAAATSRKAQSAVRIPAQEIAGAGKEPVLAAEQARKVAVARQQGSFEARTQAAADANKQAIADHQAKVDAINASHQEKLQSAKADYDLAVEEHKRATAADKAAYADKVSKMRQEWVEKSYAAEKAADDAAKIQGQRDTLQRGQDAYAQSIADNAKQTHDAVRTGLNDRWNQLRDQVGEGTPLNSERLADAIDTAKNKYLLGAPADLKQFKELVGQMTDEDAGVIDAGGGETEPILRPLSWEEGRVHSTNLGERLASGELPGNVKRAVGYVRDALEGELGKAADAAGVGKEYSALKGDWHQYMDDWHDMSSVATGGSPLARVLRAQDPGFVASAVLGKAGDRLISTMAKYRDAGANPALMAKLRQLNETAKGLPTVKVPAAPKRLAIPPPPEVAAAPEIKAVKPPNIPPPPSAKVVLPPEPIPQVSPKEVRLRKLEQAAGRPFRWYDLFPPYLAEHLLLKNPKVREWVASQPRQELPPR